MSEKLKGWFRRRSRSNSVTSSSSQSRRNSRSSTDEPSAGLSQVTSKTSQISTQDEESAPARASATPRPGEVLGKSDLPGQPDQTRGKTNPWVLARDFLDIEDQRLLGMIDNDGNTDVTTVLRNLETLAGEKRRLSEEKAWKVDFGGRRIVVRDVAGKIITWVNSFKEIGTLIAEADPVHLGVPWSIISVVLSVVTADQEQMGLLLIGLEQVTCLITRCAVYQRMYLDDIEPRSRSHAEMMADLCDAMARLYAKLFSFLAYYVRLLDLSTTTRTLKAFAQPDAVSETLTEISAYETRVSTNADLCEKLMARHAYRRTDEKFQKVRSQLQDLMSRLDTDMSQFWKKLNDEERCKIFQWISDIPYESDHYTARKGRVDGTGDWLLRHDVYKAWREADKSTVLWLNGIPGAGKTKLSSKVVDGFLSEFDAKYEGNAAFAYFYCDRNRLDHRDPVAIMRSIVRQLCAPRDDSAIDAGLEAMYTERKRKGFASDRLVSEECNKLLLELLVGYTEIYIVVDGLDECDRETRHVLMNVLDEMIEKSARPVKVYIASRTDQDLRKRYQGGTHLEVTANDNQADIEKFVLDKMEQSEFCRTKMTPKVRQKVLSTFQDKSQGMFQWATLHIGELLQLGRNADILKYLDELPKGLEAAYDKIHGQIANQIGSKKDIAFAAFKIVMVSWRPLHPFELSIAVAQDPERSFMLDEDVDIDYVLEACRNLLVITDGSLERGVKADSEQSKATPDDSWVLQKVGEDQDPGATAAAWNNGFGVTNTSICKFAHLSVQEYLENKHWNTAEANAFVAGICLRTLLCLRLSENTTYHVDELDESDDEPDLVLQVSETEKVTRMKVIFSESAASEGGSGTVEVNSARQGAAPRTRELVKDSTGEAQHNSGQDYIPFECYVELVNIHNHDDDESCFSQLFEPNVQKHKHTPLEAWTLYSAWALYAHLSMLELQTDSELTYGPTLQALQREFTGSVSEASNHYEAWTRLTQKLWLLPSSRFLDESINLTRNLRLLVRPRSRPAFGCVVAGLCDALEPWLREGSLDPNERNASSHSLLYLAALHIPTGRTLFKTCKLLLKHGADPSFVSPEMFTPLDLAVHNHNLDLVCLLIKYGVDTNIEPTILYKRLGQRPPGDSSSYDPPLVKAVASGSLDMVRVLLDAGAQPLPGFSGTSALEVAAKMARADMTSLILEKLPELPAWKLDLIMYQTLGAIPQGVNGSIQVMQLLMEHSKDMNNASVLLKAVKEENWKFLEGLLAAGADIDMSDPANRIATPLLSLFRDGFVEKATEKTRKLLDLGANVNARDADGMTPLAHCMRYPLMASAVTSEAVDDEGVKVPHPGSADAGPRRYGEAAPMKPVEPSYMEVVRELLSRGAQPDLRNKLGFTALGIACRRGEAPLKAIQLLLDYGADVNAIQGNDPGNPLTPLDVLHVLKAIGRESGAGSDDSSIRNQSEKAEEMLIKAGGKSTRLKDYESWDEVAKEKWKMETKALAVPKTSE